MTMAQRWHTRDNTSLHTRDIGCPSRFQDSDELRGVSVRGSLRVRFRHQPSHFEAGMVHLPLEMVVCCYSNLENSATTNISLGIKIHAWIEITVMRVHFFSGRSGRCLRERFALKPCQKE